VKKILCVLPQVTGGGAERFLITFLKHVDRTQYKVDLALVRRGGGFDHEIPDDVQVHVLTQRDTSTKLLAPLGPVRYVLALVKLIAETKPDAILSFGSLLNGAVALAARRSKFPNPVVLIEAIHESSEISRHYALERWTRTLFLRLTYPLASGIVAVSEDVASDLRDNFGITQGVHVIHYGVDLKHIRTLANEPVNHPWLCTSRKHSTIVACGRLVSQKGFNVLIDAISELSDDVKLILVGDGEEKVKLERQVQQLKLQERVDLVGYDRNPYRYIAKADLFVMPSLWEGLPIVLLEALCLDVPIIASDCPTGPRIILKDGDCGMLVPPGDARTLASSINKLLVDNQLRNKLSIAAKHRAEEFSAQTSVNAYKKILSKLGQWT
jgi:glycosyltransferase involved in cell wall biosynthesis